jgi:hypothetical protein
MSLRGVVVAMVLATLVGSALIFVAWPGTVTPWEFVRIMVVAAMAGVRRPLIVVGLAGMVAAAILVGTVWLSRRVTTEQPG